MRARTIVFVVVFLGAGGGLAALLARQPAETGEVRTVEARRGQLVELASASGTVEPDVFVEVKPRASGTVIDVLAVEGAAVAAGDVLLQLEPTERQEGLREAEAALTQAEAKLREATALLSVARAESAEAKAKAEVRRRGAGMALISAEEQRIAQRSAKVARTTVTLRSAQLAGAEAAVAQARVRVDTARRLVEETTIRAPIDATVLSVTVERGSVVSSGITNVGGGTPILTLADLSTLLVVGRLDQAQIGRVHEGQDVSIRVDAYPDRAFTGRVRRVSPLGQEVSSVVTFDIRITVTDPDGGLLRSGMSADLEIVTASHEDVLLLPVSALRNRGRTRHVLLPSGKEQVVRVGATDGTHVVVLEGLGEGDVVVVGGTTTARAAETPRPGGPLRMSGRRGR